MQVEFIAQGHATKLLCKFILCFRVTHLDIVTEKGTGDTRLGGPGLKNFLWEISILI